MLILKMQKNLKKVDFLKIFCIENLQGVTQPLKIFVKKSYLDVYVITPEFQKNISISFKSSNLAFQGQKKALPGGAGRVPENHEDNFVSTFICI